MPTYDYRCPACGAEKSVVQTIRQYTEQQIVPNCCSGVRMERKISVVPGMTALANALAGDRHYDGLVAPDGTDISTRTKHRQYMRDNNVTMAEDFKETWAKAEEERKKLRTGTFEDPHLRNTITEQVTKAIQ